MRIAFITVGDTRRLTGGYLYNTRLLAGLRAGGVEVVEVDAGEATLSAQEATATAFGARFEVSSFDVVVIDALARGACAPWADAWRALRPVTVLVHQLPSGSGEGDSSRDRDLEEPLLRADRLIAVSSHGRARLEARGVPADRIAVVSPGRDRLPPGASGPRPAASSGRMQRALAVAQWIPRKGLTTLVAAWARRPRPGAVLELVGETDADPSYAAEVRAAISRARPRAVVIRGPVADAALARAYGTADLFVLTSRFEGYGMVFAEALAWGLPIIAGDVEPVRGLVGDAAGLFVPPDDPAALAAALDLLLGDAALRSSMSRAAYERATHLPTWADTVRGFRRALEEALAGRAR